MKNHGRNKYILLTERNQTEKLYNEFFPLYEIMEKKKKYGDNKIIIARG